MIKNGRRDWGSLPFPLALVSVDDEHHAAKCFIGSLDVSFMACLRRLSNLVRNDLWVEYSCW